MTEPEQTHYHLCQSIRGPLTNWNLKDWRNALKWISDSDGKPFSGVAALKQSFLDELALGHEVVPIGVCGNFDWKEGCLGHPTESEPIERPTAPK